jgi:hypothetical protein
MPSARAPPALCSTTLWAPLRFYDSLGTIAVVDSSNWSGRFHDGAGLVHALACSQARRDLSPVKEITHDPIAGCPRVALARQVMATQFALVALLEPARHAEAHIYARLRSNFFHAHGSRAVCAAVVVALGLDSMADDLASAVLAYRGQSVNGAFEAIKRVSLTRQPNLERLVVVITADFALCHCVRPPAAPSPARVLPV